MTGWGRKGGTFGCLGWPGVRKNARFFFMTGLSLRACARATEHLHHRRLHEFLHAVVLGVAGRSVEECRVRCFELRRLKFYNQRIPALRHLHLYREVFQIACLPDEGLLWASL